MSNRESALWAISLLLGIVAFGVLVEFTDKIEGSGTCSTLPLLWWQASIAIAATCLMVVLFTGSIYQVLNAFFGERKP